MPIMHIILIISFYQSNAPLILIGLNKTGWNERYLRRAVQVLKRSKEVMWRASLGQILANADSYGTKINASGTGKLLFLLFMACALVFLYCALVFRGAGALKALTSLMTYRSMQ